MSAISDIKATDKDEVTITLGSGNADLPALLSDWHLGIVPNAVQSLMMVSEQVPTFLTLSSPACARGRSATLTIGKMIEGT